MTVHYTLPKGPAVSFGGFSFKANRSRKLASSPYTISDASMDVLGSSSQVDQAGYATQSSHGLYIWQYNVYCGPGDTVTSVQDELTALYTALHTQNGDGTTGQVALLTVKLLGYATQTATGIARLLTIDSAESFPTREVLHLTFKVPAGFSYTT